MESFEFHLTHFISSLFEHSKSQNKTIHVLFADALKRSSPVQKEIKKYCVRFMPKTQLVHFFQLVGLLLGLRQQSRRRVTSAWTQAFTRLDRTSTACHMLSTATHQYLLVFQWQHPRQRSCMSSSSNCCQQKAQNDCDRRYASQMKELQLDHSSHRTVYGKYCVIGI